MSHKSRFILMSEMIRFHILTGELLSKRLKFVKDCIFGLECVHHR